MLSVFISFYLWLSFFFLMRISVIGGGSWGTALAVVLARRNDVTLWVHDAALATRMSETRVNDVYLPSCSLPELNVTYDLASAVDGAEMVLTVMPSAHCRRIYEEMHAHLRPDTLIVSATKGLETHTLLRMSEVIGRVPIAVLSGPSFAVEVARGDPTAAVIASTDAELARIVQGAFAGSNLRLYTNSDPAGVEYAGALKNVIAIGAGICDGMGLGSNAMAALITRGLAEITRLACALGGRRETLAGLAGMGDLVLTCTGALSRNRTVGYELARGRKLAEIIASTRMVAEGVETTAAAVELARRVGVEMPIAERMHAVLFENQPPREALRDLMERSLKGE
jgi:glycerol-3-phosphate dehydrogenase (NAD(P)+)